MLAPARQSAVRAHITRTRRTYNIPDCRSGNCPALRYHRFLSATYRNRTSKFQQPHTYWESPPGITRRFSLVEYGARLCSSYRTDPFNTWCQTKKIKLNLFIVFNDERCRYKTKSSDVKPRKPSWMKSLYLMMNDVGITSRTLSAII